MSLNTPTGDASVYLDSSLKGASLLTLELQEQEKQQPPQKKHPEQEKQHYSKITLALYFVGPVLIVAFHLGAGLAFYTGLGVGAWLWAISLYWVRMLAITGIYHRLLTHKAYRTPPAVKWVGSLVAASAGQMGPSWWKGHHEEHHRFADEERDPHCSRIGFWWTHYQWLLSKNFLPSRLPQDIEQDKVMWLIDRLHFLPLIALGGLSYLIGGVEYLAAFFVSNVILFHGVALVNSVCHKFGTQPFTTADDSRNNGWVAFLTLGEGWHNLHHAFPWSARQGISIKQGKIIYLPDPTFWFIQLLELLGLAEKMKMPSEEAMLTAKQS